MPPSCAYHPPRPTEEDALGSTVFSVLNKPVRRPGLHSELAIPEAEGSLLPWEKQQMLPFQTTVHWAVSRVPSHVFKISPRSTHVTLLTLLLPRTLSPHFSVV